MPEVEIVMHGRWAELILNRPERRNAINGPLGLGLSEALRTIDSDPQIQAVLLRGADGAFCSGLDLKEFNAEPPPEWLVRFGDIWRATHKALFHLNWKPVLNYEQLITFVGKWYYKYYKGQTDMFDYTIRQIDEYQIAAKEAGLTWSR